MVVTTCEVSTGRPYSLLIVHSRKRPSESILETGSLEEHPPQTKRYCKEGSNYSAGNSNQSASVSAPPGQLGMRQRSQQSSNTHKQSVPGYRGSCDNLDLKWLLTLPPGKAIHELYIRFKQFEYLMRCLFHEDETLIDIMKVLSHIIKVPKIGRELKQILYFLLSDASLEGFLFSLTMFIRRMPMIGDAEQINKLPNVLQAVIAVFDFLLTSCPWTDIVAEYLPVDVCVGTAQQLSLRGSDCFQDIGEKAQQLLDKRNKVCTEIYEYQVDISSHDQSQLNEWSIALPTPEDLHYQPKRTPNIVDGEFLSTRDYLKIQRDLLREDFINPFRTALSESDDHLDKIFTGVRFLEEKVFTSSGESAHRVKFRASRKDINWRHSKLLEEGNLVCFSEDNFNTVFYATVVLRNVRELARGILTVELESGDEDSLSKSGHLTMIQSPGYFKGYAPVIEKLHKIVPENLPFSQYLVKVQTTIDVPKYLRDIRPIFDLKGVVCDCDEGCLHRQIDILDRDSWENLITPILDTSQKYALHLALTNEVALIQGPPGTGKSYVGLKVMQALLQNDHFWRHSVQEGTSTCPIMVVCYTNHALDQFLEGVMDLSISKNDIVRVGRQCKSTKVQPLSLHLKVQRARRQPKYAFLRGCQPNVTMKSKALNEFLNGNYTSDCCHLYCLFLSQEVIFDLKDYCNISFPFQCDDRIPLKFVSWLDEDIKPENEALQSINEERLDDEDFESNKLYIALGEEGLKTFVQRLGKLHPMTKLQARTYLTDHVHQPKNTERLPLFKYCLNKLLEAFHDLKELNTEQRSIHDKRTKDIKVSCLQEAKVIGLTTTAAARDNDLLSKVQSKILIVEEAAEVLEPHLIAALTKHTQHLILIGDHKQLRPKTNDSKFGKTHKLDISLFERLVTNGLHHATLKVQHRMRPEISQIVSDHIYDKKLIDHEKTKYYGDVRGVKRNLYFISHDKEESAEDPDLKSYANVHEATFIACCSKYLLQQEYNADQITIVTPYSSQVNEIKYQLEQKEVADVHVTTIDNYQGEENEIILLSLVRSNKKKIPGFVRDENRICVALSRARQGFYCIGNFQLFQECSDLWSSITEDVKSRGFYGDSLELVCSQHKVETKVSCADDFKQVPDGGCNQPCEEIYRECGHQCPKKCHPNDRNHDSPCKHPCPKRLQPCEHPCTKTCGEKCDKVCTLKVDRELLCGHREIIECHLDEFQSVKRCRHPCGSNLSCGHDCSGQCGICHQGRLHIPCTEMCDKILLCGHMCSSEHPCSGSCPPCTKDCAYECSHSKCGTCFYPCKPCDRQCRWRCQHSKCTKRYRCGELCNRDRCDMPCTKTLKDCRHPCQGICGEPCPPVCHHPKCNTVEKKFQVQKIYRKDELDKSAKHRYIQLQDCKHIFVVQALDKWMARRNDEPVRWKCCPICRVPVMKTLRYANIVNQILHDLNELKKRESHYLSSHQRKQMKMELSLLASISMVEFGSLLSTYFEQEGESDEVLQRKYLSTISKLEILRVRNDSDKLLRELHESKSEQIIGVKSLELLQSQANGFLEWIEGIHDTKLSDQMILDLTAEHKRLFLLLKCYKLQYALSAKTSTLSDEHHKVLKDIQSACENNLNCEEYQAEIERLQTIQTEYGIQVIGENEGKLINALGLKANGWYRCPDEHYYNFNDTVNEYDGKCPECCSTQGSNSKIDVKDHRIEDSDDHNIMEI